VSAEAIAKGLSEPLRRAFRRALETPEGLRFRHSEPWSIISYLYWNDMIGGRYVLTPLGNEIRAIIMSEASK
jgi:hypothetical protein